MSLVWEVLVLSIFWSESKGVETDVMNPRAQVIKRQLKTDGGHK